MEILRKKTETNGRPMMAQTAIGQEHLAGAPHHVRPPSCPVFVMSGEEDRNTRPTDTRILFERARTPKQIWLVSNAGHVDLHRAAQDQYETRVLVFLAQMTRS